MLQTCPPLQVSTPPALALALPHRLLCPWLLLIPVAIFGIFTYFFQGEFLNCHSGTTSNMSTHTKRHHPARVPLALPSSMTTGTYTGQLRLQDMFAKKMPMSCQRAQMITRHIGRFIATDLRPYSVVEDEGFRDLVEIPEGDS